MILSKNTKNLSIFHLTQWFQFQNPDRLIIRTVITGTRYFKAIERICVSKKAKCLINLIAKSNTKRDF